ncbi:MAG: ComEA family DNA-binding protein [Chitinophagales bacterium]
MTKQRLLLFCFMCILFISQPLQAQKANTNKTAEDIELDELIENITSDLEDADINYDTFLEKLYDYLERPININKANFEDLNDLGLLNAQQIDAILKHREQFGRFLAIYELQAIPELDMETIRKISPFMKAQDLNEYNIPFKDLMYKGSHQVFFRYQQVLEKQEGYQKNDTIYTLDVTDFEGISSEQTFDTRGFSQSDLNGLYVNDTLSNKAYSQYKGSPQRYYARYRYNYGNKISYGITAEKDPGEEFFTGSQKRGFDFYSAHFYMSDVGAFKHIALGDYTIKLGQGLVAWTSLGFRKGSYVMDIMRQANPVKPYTSVGESIFFRGAAATLGFAKNFEVTAFGSYKPLDGNVLTPNIDDNELEDAGDGTDFDISSIQLSGFHRTDAELEDRHAIKETSIGGNIAYKSRRFSLGINALYVGLSSDLMPNLTLDRKYAFRGDSYFNASFDYKYLYKNFHFFGETAVNDAGGVASLNGILIGLDPRMSLSILHRHYSRKYYTAYPAAFAESSKPTNEQGLFIGTIFKPVKKWTVNAYFDIYQHDWLRFQADAPSNGTDYLVQLEYKHSRSAKVYVRYRSETKKKNATANLTPSDYLTNHTRSSFRFNAQYNFNKTITLKSRLEVSWFDKTTEPKESGYVLMQDVSYKPLSSPISFAARYALFDTPSYDTRIYAYENDVLYSFSVPPYYNKGSRFYLTMRYRMSRNINIWLRYAQTYHQNQNVFGSTNDEIQGHTKTEVKAMIRFKF